MWQCRIFPLSVPIWKPRDRSRSPRRSLHSGRYSRDKTMTAVDKSGAATIERAHPVAAMHPPIEFREVTGSTDWRHIHALREAIYVTAGHRQLVRLRSQRYTRLGLSILTATPQRSHR